MTQREQAARDRQQVQFSGRRQQRPLIGRTEEQAVLRRLLLETEACKQEGSARAGAFPEVRPAETYLASRLPCVILQGEPGIGKTRLAEELSREALERGWTVVWSRLYAQENVIPYRLWTQIFQQVIIKQDLLPLEELQARALDYLPLASLLPEMADMLPPDMLSSSITAELGQEKLRLWEAARALLASVCERVPLLIVLDDLHCVDDSSCELLGYLVRYLAGCPLLLLGTYRQNEHSLTHPLSQLFGDLHRERLITVLTVPALTEVQIGMLLAGMPEPLLQQIQRQAAGNPLFAEELARVLPAMAAKGREQALLAASVDSLRMFTLPQTITAVFDQRLRLLSQECQLLLNNAAILGGSFSFSTLYRMETAGARAVDMDSFALLLEEALYAKVLTEEPNGVNSLYHFWHPLLMSHLYEKLSAARRATLHRRAAEVMREMYAKREAEGAASITYHLVRGGASPEQIVSYAELAGNHAYGLSAYPEAERYYRLALQYREELASSAETALPHAHLLELLGECTRVQGKSEEARGFYEQALEIRDRHIFSTSRAAAGLEAQIRSLIVCEIGVTWYNVGNNAHALVCYKRSEQYLRDAGITGGPAWAMIRFLQSYISWREGTYDDAQRMAGEALVLFEETRNAPLLTRSSTETPTFSPHITRILMGDPVELGRTHALLSILASAVGQPGVANTHLFKALEIYERHHNQREMATVHCILSDLYLKKAEHAQAREALQRSLTLAEHTGDIPLIAVVYINMGLLAMRLGNLTEAEAHHRRGFGLAEQINDPVYMSMFLVQLAIVLYDLDKSVEAMQTLRRALTIAHTMHSSYCTGIALIGLGSIRITQATRCQVPEERTRLLSRAGSTLRRALVCKGLEIDMQVEGQLLLAQALLLRHELEDAQAMAAETLKAAQASELLCLAVRTLRVQGSIFAAQGQPREAQHCFVQALSQCRAHGLHLDLARTLRCSAEALVQMHGPNEQSLSHLREAHTLLSACHAPLDLRIIESLLAASSS